MEETGAAALAIQQRRKRYIAQSTDFGRFGTATLPNVRNGQTAINPFNAGLAAVLMPF
jgi:hypothetical protein